MSMWKHNVSLSADRRHCLRKLAGLGLAISLPNSFAAKASTYVRKPTTLSTSPIVLASAFETHDAEHGVALIDIDGVVQSRLELPARGHDCVFHPTGHELVAFARRPGTFMAIASTTGVRPVRYIHSVPGRHFYGHGVFSLDGKRLYATENDYKNARGTIGIYDVADDYRRVGEYDSHGVGPHDIGLHSDGRSLVVANGGIATHPDFGRAKLNLPDMKSNIAVVDSLTGDLILHVAQTEEWPRLSLRHLAVDSNANWHLGGQYEGDPEDAAPLVGVLRRNGALSLRTAPRQWQVRLKNYVSSICVIPNTPWVATSSARGGVVLLWNALSGQAVHVLEVPDGSGVSGTDGALHVSDGAGRVQGFSIDTDGVAQSTGEERVTRLHWDNHLAI